MTLRPRQEVDIFVKLNYLTNSNWLGYRWVLLQKIDIIFFMMIITFLKNITLNKSRNSEPGYTYKLKFQRLN
jgi:hypothetical protein